MFVQVLTITFRIKNNFFTYFISSSFGSWVCPFSNRAATSKSLPVGSSIAPRDGDGLCLLAGTGIDNSEVEWNVPAGAVWTTLVPGLFKSRESVLLIDFLCVVKLLICLGDGGGGGIFGGSAVG